MYVCISYNTGKSAFALPDIYVQKPEGECIYISGKARVPVL